MYVRTNFRFLFSDFFRHSFNLNQGFSHQKIHFYLTSKGYFPYIKKCGSDLVGMNDVAIFLTDS